jgi:hypothetical protein
MTRQVDFPMAQVVDKVTGVFNDDIANILVNDLADLLADFMSVVAEGSPEVRTLGQWMAQLVAIRSAQASGHVGVPLFANLPATPSQGIGAMYEVGSDTDARNGVYRWDGPGTGWTKTVDKAAALQSSVDQVNRILLEAIVFGSRGRIDRSNLYGGNVTPGFYSLYLARPIFIKRGTGPAANLTIGPDSTALPGFVRLDISSTDRTYVYLDLNDNTYKTVVAVSGDMTLPAMDSTRIVPLAVFWGEGFYCPFELLDVDPQQIGALTLSRPIAWSRSELKVRFPAMLYLRRGLSGISHTPANGELWEEVAGTASTSNPITYWLDTRTNTIQASAPGAAPYNPQGDAVFLGRSIAGTFWSPYPHNGRGVNRCGWGKRPILAPFKLFPAQAQEVDITEPNLLALGFTKGMRNVQGAPGSPFVFVGDVIPDGRSPQRYATRLHVQTNIDDYFGNLPQARFEKAGGAAFLTATMALEKKLSSKAARFLITFDVPDPLTSLVDQASPWTKIYLGVTNNNPAADIVITGGQYDFAGVLGSDPSWIDLGDFPPMRDLNARVTDLEGLAADPAVELLYGPDMWLSSDPEHEQQIYPDGLNAVGPRNRRKNFRAGLCSLRTLPNGEVRAFAPDSDGKAIPIVASRMGPTVDIWANRYSEGISAANDRHTREGVIVHQAPAVVSGTIGLHMTGDSLWAPQAVKAELKSKLASIGITANFIGPRQSSIGLGNVAYGGWSGASLINAITLPAQPGQPAGLTQPLAVGQETAYLGYLDDVDPDHPTATTKLTFNVYLRVATGGDDPAKVFNGYIVDFNFFRNRWASTALGVLPLPTHALFNLGTGDLNLFPAPDDAAWLTKALQIFVGSMLADGVQHVGLAFQTFPNSTRDVKWPQYVGVIKAIMAYRASLSAPDRAKVDILPAWAHMSQDYGWVTTGAADPVTGAATKTITDQTHNYHDLTRTQVNEVYAAWLACKVAGV